jgi:hypothetical protein
MQGCIQSQRQHAAALLFQVTSAKHHQHDFWDISAAAAAAAVDAANFSGSLPDEFASSNVSLACLPTMLSSSSNSNSMHSELLVLMSRTLGFMYTWRLGDVSSSSSSSSITGIVGHGGTLLSLSPLPARSFLGQVFMSMPCFYFHFLQ